MTKRGIPIRWWLTACYAAMLTIALTLLGAVIYVGLRHELNDNLSEQLSAQTSLIQAAIRRDGGQPILIWQTSSDPYEEQFARLWSGNGSLIMDSAEIQALTAEDTSLIESALSGNSSRETVTRVGVEFLTQTEPVRDGETIIGVLQVGASREDVTDTLGALRLLLAIAAPLLLILSGIGGYFLAGRALAPVTSITELAKGIGEADLGSRLDLALPDDEIGRLATTFNAMLDRIERAFERQRRFTGDAAHELRTPISLIRSRVDVALTRERSTEQYQSELRHLRGDLVRLTDLASALLTMARSDAGHLTIQRDRFDLADTVRAVLAQYEAIADDAELSLRAETEPTPINADEDLLIQVLVNLMDNSISHTPGGGSVTIGCRANGDQAQLWVDDSGFGIPAELRERVFDRFYRVDSGRTREHGGAGLGLSICRAVIEAHEGTIRVVERVGPGTRVEIGMGI